MTSLQGRRVSRETMDRLEVFSDLLRKWNPRINLVAKSTLDELWQRHILDSAQVFDLSKQPVDHWVDMGSGGGFPGLVVAILALEHAPSCRVTLIESDARKCAFLRTVIRETGLNTAVLNERIERAPPQKANVISARALADLETLLSLSAAHSAPSAVLIFPKGETWKTEVKTAQTKWQFDLQVDKSKTSEGSVILSIRGAVRV